MEKYEHRKIEKKWQKYWQEHRIFEVQEPSCAKASEGRDKFKKKFYGLIEFPYPSGDGLHTGHLRSYTALDIVCRKKRMEGYNVLYPIGFDSFGLPTENYAIKRKENPRVVTRENIKIFTRQLKSVGFSFDWSRAFSTTDEDYYKWTQWIFVEMFKKGLAYKAKENINWCRSCKIGLANEEVVNGKCERCGAEVVKKEKEQWMLKITKYADRLIKDLDKVDYLERIKTQQINWIGRSEGADVDFKVKGLKEALRVFTTRPDTLFGATFMVLAPEHSLISNFKFQISNWKEVEEYIDKAKKKSDLERTDLAKEKAGVELKGVRAINPVNNKEIPIWVADYVMMGYGTGAIMAVPAHDERDYEFAKKFGLEIIEVIKGGDIKKEAFVDIDSGKMVNSGEFNGMRSDECIKKIIQWLEKRGLGKRAVNYKLHDWIFSRQRYWGEPIPIIYCRKCWEGTRNKKQETREGIDFIYIDGKEHKIIPVPEKDLPVVLPKTDNFMPTNEGDSPLAKVESWINTKCPRCDGPATRETDVMPNWAGSNWYFLRYCDSKNNKALAGADKLKYWMAPVRRSEGVGGVDWYNGGMEHTTLHLLYSRFVYKFLYDIGAVPKECGPEPYKKRTAHGMVLGKGGIKMSKSKGNVINPDEYIEKYGADTVRLYEMFMGPFDQVITWEDKGVVGVKRFLDKVLDKAEDIYSPAERERSDENYKKLSILINKTIKKVTEDIENMRFNTAISQMMIFINESKNLHCVEFEKEQEVFEKFLILLSPFAPHICEELWSRFSDNYNDEKYKKSIIFEKWSKHDKNLIQAEEIELVIQVNGKVRDKIKVAADISESQAKKIALESHKMNKWLEGKRPKKVIYIKGRLVSIVV